MNDVTAPSAPENTVVPANPASPAAAPPASPTERWDNRSAPASASPTRPGAITSEAFHRLAPDVQAGYANLPGGEWIERSKLESATTAPTTAASGDPATATPGGATVENGELVFGKFRLSPDDVTGLMERHALEQSRKATMPATAAEYSLDLPSDFVMPEGQNWKWATDHPVLGPLIGQAKEFAFASAIDQPAFSKMMSLFAASQIHESQMVAKAQVVEREKLGPNIALRVDAVTQFIRASVSDDKISKGMTQRILTADDVIGWERIIGKKTSQGAASFSQAHREPAGPQGRASEAEYAAMSQGERYAYAKSFDQKQFKNGG